ncbi:hypothetical protein U1Q18_049048 [Sarracenia purpurea var. burkii]
MIENPGESTTTHPLDREIDNNPQVSTSNSFSVNLRPTKIQEEGCFGERKEKQGEKSTIPRKKIRVSPPTNVIGVAGEGDRRSVQIRLRFLFAIVTSVASNLRCAPSKDHAPGMKSQLRRHSSSSPSPTVARAPPGGPAAGPIPMVGKSPPPREGS